MIEAIHPSASPFQTRLNNGAASTCEGSVLSSHRLTVIVLSKSFKSAPVNPRSCASCARLILVRCIVNGMLDTPRALHGGSGGLACILTSVIHRLCCGTVPLLPLYTRLPVPLCLIAALLSIRLKSCVCFLEGRCARTHRFDWTGISSAVDSETLTPPLQNQHAI